MKDEVTKAEIIWTLQKVGSHTSARNQASATDLFPLMFPDSEIASRMKLHKDKIGYVTTFGLGPYFHQNLLHELNNCEFFSISFDESLNDIAQRNQMDILIRFWNRDGNKVSTRYLTSLFLGHATSQDLLSAFVNTFKDNGLDFSKLLQVSLDGPNVNLKFLSDLKAFLKEDYGDGPQLLETGTCCLHSVNGAFKAAHRKVEWQVTDFFRVLYYLFKDFPSRRADFILASGTDVFPLKFCSVRWVENSKVISRAITMIPALKKYVNAVKAKPPQTANFSKVETHISDPLLLAKLGFLQSVCVELEEFLTRYQTENPLLPFLWDDLNNLIRSLLGRFIKDDVLKAVTSGKKLTSVDVHKKENLKPMQIIDIGFSAVTALKGLKDLDILVFKQDCRNFLQDLCKKLMDKCPLTYKVTRAASCLSPKTMTNESIRESRITLALEAFVEKQQMAPTVADMVRREYLKFCSNPKTAKTLSTFNLNNQGLDSFLHDLFSTEGVSSAFITFMQKICVLFHSNAAVERSFSFNKECLIENLLEESLVAQRNVLDSIHAAGGVSKVNVTKSMIHYVRNSSSRKNEYLKACNEKEDKELQEKKSMRQEIKLLELKKKEY